MALFVLNWYSNESYLPGVLSDYNNLKRDKFERKLFLLNEDANFDSIKRACSQIQPKLIWFCGHGSGRFDLSEKDCQSEYYLLHDHTPLTDNQMSDIISESKMKNLVLVFDVCHSGTLVDLNYKWNFESQSWGINTTCKYKLPDLKTKVISISGCSDQTVSYETREGGFLTNFIRSLLNHYGYINLKIFAREYKKQKNMPFVTITTNDLNLKETDVFLSIKDTREK